MAPRKVTLAAVLLAFIGASAFAIHRILPASGDGECGPTSLYALSSQLGSTRPYQEIRKGFHGRYDEVSFTDIQTAARTDGVVLIGEKLSVADLRRRHILGILHIDHHHFVAIVGFGRNGVRIADPVSPGETVTSVWAYPDLDKQWDGRMLVMNQGPIEAHDGH